MLGIEEIDAAGLAALMERSDAPLLVDVRSPAEMAQGMLPGAQVVPMHLVPLRLDEWRSHEKIVFYCRTGARSGQVCAFLQQQGIQSVVNLRGGIVDWHRQGLHIEVPPAANLSS
jgi:rhodanese-related sulfurtransferase